MFGALSATSPDKFGPSAYFAIRDLGEVCEHMMLPRNPFLAKEQEQDGEVPKIPARRSLRRQRFRPQDLQ